MAMELPDEDLTEEERREGIVGELKLAMPGTRDAANSWQEEVAKWGETVGFVRSKWNPCLYSDVERKVWRLLHGVDFMMVMGRSEVGRLRKALEKRFTVKVEVCGHGEGEEREVTILNE